MLFQKLRQFRRSTEQEYKRLQWEEMEQWKRDVMELHEKAEFLFYFDEAQTVSDSLLRFLVTGELVKGTMEPGRRLYLHDGQGRLLGEGAFLVDGEEYEEKHMGIVHRKRKQGILKLSCLYGQKAGEMGVSLYRRQAEKLFAALSLVTDCTLD